MDTYVIAVKPAARSTISVREALDRIRDIGGVAVLVEGQSGRARIRASAAGLKEVKRVLAATCHIEPLITYVPQAATS